MHASSRDFCGTASRPFLSVDSELIARFLSTIEVTEFWQEVRNEILATDPQATDPKLEIEKLATIMVRCAKVQEISGW